MPRRQLNEIAALIPPIRRLRAQRDDLAAEADSLRRESATLRAQADTLRSEAEARRAEDEARQPKDPAYNLYPPGHFYSPQPDLQDVRERAGVLFDRSGDVPGVAIDLEAQRQLLRELVEVMGEWPYGDAAAAEGLRYKPDNGYFGWTDSQLWYGLLRRLDPGRIIEVGSGWSTALMLDTLERHDLRADVTAVEPFPDRLRSVLRPGDHERLTLLEAKAQDLPAERLAGLEAGDVLFIDSTHVSKVGSDVNFLLFEVFPRLPAGVYVHVHDIAYPFEYPQEWVLEGRAWNEAYLLRAYLTQNPRWKVLLWPSLLWLRHQEDMQAALHPDSKVDGGSLWLVTT